jgi:acyl carrier protein
LSRPQEHARALLARALGIGLEGVRDAAAIGTQERWDSLAHMCLVLELEAALGRPLATDELLEISSLDGIARVLAPKPAP